MKYSLAFRLWHWMNALVVLALVGTVLLRWTLLSKTANAQILSEKLLTMGISITDTQAITLAKSLRVELWQWHITLGFIFAGLLLLRLVLERFHAKEKTPFKELDIHHKAVEVLYCILYVVLTILAATGLLIYFSNDFGFAKDVTHTIKEVHETLYYYVAFFIPLHVVGVFIADATKEKGLVSEMIHGQKRVEN